MELIDIPSILNLLETIISIVTIVIGILVICYNYSLSKRTSQLPDADFEIQYWLTVYKTVTWKNISGPVLNGTVCVVASLLLGGDGTLGVCILGCTALFVSYVKSKVDSI